MSIQALRPYSFQTTGYIMPQQQYPVVVSEESPLDTYLKSRGLPAYNENTEEDMLKKKDYLGLITVHDKINGSNNAALIGKYAAMPEFDELAQSKYFNTPYDFTKLTKIISELEQKKQDALKKVSSPFYISAVIPDVTRTLAGTDVAGCVRNINKFFQSKFSDDLKMYLRNDGEFLTDLYRTSVNLSYLDAENPSVTTLDKSMFLMM